MLPAGIKIIYVQLNMKILMSVIYLASQPYWRSMTALDLGHTHKSVMQVWTACINHR